MSENIAQQVKQLANRLENATNTERVDALQDLQGISKQSPEASKIVGELALKNVLDFLKEQGSSEEYQEALDLIYRLVKNKTAGKGNTALILDETGSVELFLDLLEHEDLMVGVMSSQILTEIHSNDSVTLESQIMLCPDGMNKLLQRLPDSSREEVRNQAIVLIQQLTSVNDEMKQQVMFMDGMEKVFDIIRTEGAAGDAGLVVQDCLQICCNILNGNEKCQRYFFSMYGVAYILRMSDFFDPHQLESMFQLQDADDEDSRGGVPWFDQPTRLACALLAMSALCNSLSSRDALHQKAVGKDTSIVVPSAAFWIARRGPVQLVNAALTLLCRVVEGNSDMALQLSQEQIKISPAALGRNIPHGVEVPGLAFSWRPSHEDDRRLVSLMSLLVERYVYAGETWHVDDGLHLNVKLSFDYDVSAGSDAFAAGCLSVFETVLAAGPDTSDFLVQCVLAPIAMFDDAPDGHPQKQLESMRPLGLLLLNLLVEGSQKVVAGHQQQQYGMQGGGAQKSETMITTEKAANVLALVFVYGSSLARELSTRIMTSHISAQIAGVTTNTFLIPVLLGFASSAARITGGAGFPLLVAILRLMATVVTECEPAAKLMLENASNLFVVDLASVASENTGMPSSVQVSACLFLGCCLDALKNPEEDGEGGASPHDGHGFTKHSFIGMIDARIGLGRFSDILKKPFSTTEQTAMAGFFFSPSFQSFYVKRVESVKKGILEHYTGAGSGSIDAVHQAVIDMQRDRIVELEALLAAGGSVVVPATPTTETVPVVQIVDDSHVQQIQLLKDEIAQRALAQESAEGKLGQMTLLCDEQVHQLEALEATRDRLQALVADNVAGSSVDSQQLQDDLQASRLEVAHLEEALRVAQHEGIKEEGRALEAEALNDELRDRLQTALLMSDEVTLLKQTVLQDGEEQRRLHEAITQRERKLDLLQSELAGLAVSRDTSALDRKVADLESRNAQLKQQMWAVESELQAAKLQIENSNSLGSSTKDEDETNKSLEAVEDLLPTVTQFVLNLGLSLEATPAGATAAQLGVFMEGLLNQCGEAISSAVNQCSDLAEGAQLSDLQGGEGSVTRFLDCCVRLSEELNETRARAEEADRLRVMLADSETEVDEERTARQAADADFLELQDQAEGLRADLQRMAADIEKLAAERDSLSSQLAGQADAAGLVDQNLSVRIDQLTQEGVDLREQVAVLTETNERLSASLSSEQGEEAALNEQVARLTSEASDLTNEVFDLQHQLSEAQSRESELNDVTVSHEQALLHSNSEHQSQLDELHADINALQLTLSAAQAAHSQDEQTAFALSQLQEQVAALEAEKSRAVQAVDEERGVVQAQLQSANEMNNGLENDRARLAAQIESLAAQLVNTQEELAQTERARETADEQIQSLQDQAEGLGADLQRMAADIEKLAAERDSLSSQLAGQADAAGLVDQNLFVRIDQLTQEGVDLRKQVTALIATNERLSASLSSEQGEEAALNEQVARLTSEASDLTNEVFDLQHQLSEAQSRESELNDVTVSHEQALLHSNSEHQSQLDELHADINALQLTLSAAQAAHSQDEQTTFALSQLQEQVAALEAEKSRAVQAVDEERGVVQAQLQSVNEMNSGLESDRARLATQIESLAAQLVNTQEELAQTRELADEQIQSLQDQLSAIRTEDAALSGQSELIATHVATIDALTADVTRLTAELSASRETIVTEESAIADLTGQVIELNGQIGALVEASAVEHAAAVTSASTIARLTDELSDSQGTGATREATIATLTEQLVGLSEQLVLLTAEKQERDAAAATIESTVISLNNEIERLNEELRSNQNTTSAATETTIASLTAEIERLTEDLRCAEETAADESALLNFDVERLKSALQSAEEEALTASAALNAELTRLLGELSSAHEDAKDLREKQAALESVAGSVDEHKERVKELQKQINGLHTVVADLQAKAQFDAKAHNEAISVEKAHCLAVNEKICELQAIHQGMASELAQLKQDKLSLEAKVLEAKSTFDRVEAELSAKTVHGYNQSLENEGLRSAVVKKDAEMAALQSAFEDEKQRIESRLAIESSSDPFKAQDHELRRLAASADRLSKELHSKEQELHAVQAQLRRKEGELAGVKSSLSGCEADMEQLRIENETLSNHGTVNERLLKDLRREHTNLEASLQLERGELEGLRSQLQSEKSRVQLVEVATSQHSELVVRVEKKLRDLSAWMLSSFGLSGAGSAYDEALLLQMAGGGHSLVEYVDSLRSLIETLAGRLGAQVREQHDKLEIAERRLSEAVQQAQHQHSLHQQQLAQHQATQQRSSASTSLSSPLFENMMTPAKKNPLNGHVSPHDLSGGMLTPIPHKGEGHTLMLHSDTLVKSAPRTGSKLTISPGAKDAGRLNAEMLREKRKLSVLQEQHSDLLGLLAQQEVEMGVFRQALEDKLSASELLRLEGQAQRSVIELYGTYTDFRHFDAGLLGNH